MTHTVVAMFDHESSARNAALRLLDTGVPRDHIDMANATTYSRTDTSQKDAEDKGFFDRVGNFFRNLFEDETQAEKYSEFAQNKTLVTVHAQSSQEAVHAAQILDEGGAIEAHSRTKTLEGRNVTDESLPINDNKLDDHSGTGTSGIRTRSRIFNRPVYQDYRLFGLNYYEDDLNRDTRTRSRNY